jgi:hypothetical protein
MHDVSAGQNLFPGGASQFSAEPAAGDHPRGGLGQSRGASGWHPDPPGHASPDCDLENEILPTGTSSLAS